MCFSYTKIRSTLRNTFPHFAPSLECVSGSGSIPPLAPWKAGGAWQAFPCPRWVLSLAVSLVGPGKQGSGFNRVSVHSHSLSFRTNSWHGWGTGGMFFGLWVHPDVHPEMGPTTHSYQQLTVSECWTILRAPEVSLFGAEARAREEAVGTLLPCPPHARPWPCSLRVSHWCPQPSYELCHR